MEKKSEEKEECCSSGTCCGVGGCRGCGCKVILALVLLLLGGVIGYLGGSHCAIYKKWGCPMSAPVTPPSK